MDEEQELRRGEEARRIIESELYQEAFRIIRENVHTDFENSKAGESEGRDKCWAMLKALNEIERHLSSVFETGKMARAAREARKPKTV